MKRHVVIYGVLGGLLIMLLRYIEYRYIVIEHSVEIYGGLIAIVFVTLGLGLDRASMAVPRQPGRPTESPPTLPRSTPSAHRQNSHPTRRGLPSGSKKSWR